MSKSALYDKDFYAWANQQAALLRAGKLDAADIAHIAEEIESMGRTEKRELVNRLAILLLHLLKWQFQPERRGRSWQFSIREQRRKLHRHMRDNPSLKAVLSEAIADAYEDAVADAVQETGLPESTFPAICPYLFDLMGDDGFWPE